jgi:hypothetical protein
VVWAGFRRIATVLVSLLEWVGYTDEITSINLDFSAHSGSGKDDFYG